MAGINFQEKNDVYMHIQSGNRHDYEKFQRIMAID